MLRICRGHNCGKLADALEDAARRYISDNSLAEVVGLAQEACFGRCSLGPNILVERWRDGKRNDQAMLSLMMGGQHPDMRFEFGVRPEDLPKLIRWHLRAYRSSIEEA